MRKLFSTLLLSLLGMSLFAQVEHLKDIPATQAVSKKVISLILEEDLTAAFAELNRYWPMPQNELVQLEETTVKYFNILGPRFGPMIGTQKVKNEVIGDFAIRETFIILYENSAIRVKFTFFKNDKGWIINGFKWDDSFTDEFVEGEITH